MDGSNDSLQSLLTNNNNHHSNVDKPISRISILTSKQTDELRKSILDYLYVHQFTETLKAFEKEAILQTSPTELEPKYAGLLEKKWSSVVRLQKKVLELESKVNQLQQTLDQVHFFSSSSSSSSSSNSALNALPRPPERHCLKGHRAPITSLAFHPSYQQLASSSEDATIKLWDFETGEYEKTLKGHTKTITYITYDDEGKFLASSSADLTIKLWDTQNVYQNIRTFKGHDHSVSCIVFLPNQRLASCSRDKSIRIWDLNTGYCLKSFTAHSDWVRMIAKSIDGTWLASCSNDQTACLWSIGSTAPECKQQFYGHEHVIECIAFAPLTSTSFIQELSFKELNLKDLPGPFFATGSRDKEIRLWNGISGQCIFIFKGHDNWVRQLLFHPCGKYLISVSDDKTVRCWDLSAGRCSHTMAAHSQFITCVAMSNTPYYLATGSVDNEIRIWSCK